MSNVIYIIIHRATRERYLYDGYTYQRKENKDSLN